jgi:hypothetical protein
VKKTIKKCNQSGTDFHVAMMNLRATPVDAKLPSPAQMLMGRPIATLLPARMTPRPEDNEYKQQMEHRKEIMKTNYDKHAGVSHPPLHAGQMVRILDKQTREWMPAEVVGRCEEPRSYNVRTEKNVTFRRNRGDIRERPTRDEGKAGRKSLDCQQPNESPERNTTIVPMELQPEMPKTTSSQLAKESTSLPMNTPCCQNAPVVTRSGRLVITPARYRDDP